MPSIVGAGNQIASALVTFAVLIVATALIAFVVARRYGNSRVRQRAIFAVIGTVGLLSAAIYTHLRLRGMA
jgi:predicted permease